jgi:hypothetical protein
MLGTTTVYLSHMPMFGKQDHHYQLTLQIGLDADATQAYLADKANHPYQVYNLSNLDSDRFTLPDLVSGKIARYSAAIYRGYSNAGGGTTGDLTSGFSPGSGVGAAAGVGPGLPAFLVSPPDMFITTMTTTAAITPTTSTAMPIASALRRQ